MEDSREGVRLCYPYGEEVERDRQAKETKVCQRALLRQPRDQMKNVPMYEEDGMEWLHLLTPHVSQQKTTRKLYNLLIIQHLVY